MDKWNREILRLAVPSVISNVTVPLLGLVDLAVVGHIGNEAYISAIAVGTMIFNVMYWLLGFLRMGTSGMTSQAFGRHDGGECLAILVRTLLLGIGIGLFFIAVQQGIERGMLWLMNTPEASWNLVSTYFRIVIWGAPAAERGQHSRLAVFCLHTGLGCQRCRCRDHAGTMDRIFRVPFGGIPPDDSPDRRVCPVWRKRNRNATAGNAQACTDSEESMGRVLPCEQGYLPADALSGGCKLLLHICRWKTRDHDAGRQYTSDDAVHALLLYDGRFCLCWRSTGDRAGLHKIVRRLFVFGVIMASLFTAVYVAGGAGFLHLLTDDAAVVASARPYLLWAYLIPAAGMAAFILDGVFIGLTATKGMLFSTAVAMTTFFLVYSLLRNSLANDALWIAFLSFLFMRGAASSVWAYRYSTLF